MNTYLGLALGLLTTTYTNHHSTPYSHFLCINTPVYRPVFGECNE